MVSFALAVGCTWLCAAPSITQQPAVITATGGTSATFAVVANGSGTLTYQWRRAGAPIAGAIGSTFTIANVGPADAGAYEVAVTDGSAATTLSQPGWLVYHSAPGQLWGIGTSSALGSGDPGLTEVPQTVAVGVTRVFAGFGRAFFLKADGSLWGTGTNYSGALGDGTMDLRSLPVLIANDVIQVGTGMSHTLFLRQDHSLWAVGSNSQGQLGDGTQTDRLTPVHVADGVAQISVGFQHNAYLTAGGDLYVWGNGSGGTLGNGATASVLSPQLLASGVRQVSAGAFSTVFIKNDHSLWGTGEWASNVPVQIDTDVAHAVSEDWRVFYVKNNGSLWFRGGIGSYYTSSQVDAGVSIASSSGWGPAACYLKTDGTACVYGLNGAPKTPTGPGMAVASGIAQVAAGTDFVYLLGTDGVLSSFGYYGDGQLGIGRSNVQAYPVKLGTGIVATATGGRHSLALDSGGTLWAAGENSSGQLGDGTRLSRATPVVSATGVTQCVAGPSFTLYIDSAGTLWSVGDNAYGQLGDGTLVSRSTPFALATNVVACAAGNYHTLYVTRDGTLWATGGNFNGQLADPGTTDRRTTPVAVATGVVACAAGTEHSLFLKADGTLWAMGWNYHGQLGDGTTTSRPLPVPVASGVTAVSAGSNASLFRTLDGTLWAMGLNVSGQFGTGNTANALLPVPIATDVAAFAGGTVHALHLKRDGTLWAAGDNTYGQLGDGTTGGRLTWQPVAAEVTGLAAGGPTSLFIQKPTGGTPPTFTVQPQPVVASVGAPAVFSASVAGSSPIGYQWYKDGVALAGANSPELHLPCVTAVDVGVYSLVAANPAGTAYSTEVGLTLAAPVEIVTAPQSQNAVAGASVTFAVAATGDGLTYQWLKNGESITGAVQPSLTLTNVQPADAGLYSVRVDGVGGSTMSLPAMLGIGGLAGPRYRLLDYFLPMVVGNTWLYTPSFTDPEFTHLREQVVSTDLGITCYTGRTNPTSYVVSAVARSRQQGHFDGADFDATRSRTSYFYADGVRCGLLGENEEDENIPITCDGALTFPATMAVGESSVATSDFYRGGLWFGQVSYGLQLVGIENVATPAGKFPGCLHIRYFNNLDPEEVEDQWLAPGVGTVRIRQSDDVNPAVTFNLASYHVQAPVLPAITAEPADATIALGSPAALAVEAVGTAPVAYQWYRGDSGDTSQPIAGATAASYTTPALDVWGRYWVRVSNRSSYVDSRTVLVEVVGGTMQFADWVAQGGVPAAQRGPLATPAGDGVTNLMKFALGLAPLANATNHLPVATTVAQSGQPLALALLFQRNTPAQGLRYALETSPDLVTWMEVAGTLEVLGTNPDGTQNVRLRETAPAVGSRRFGRLKVELLAP